MWHYLSQWANNFLGNAERGPCNQDFVNIQGLGSFRKGAFYALERQEDDLESIAFKSMALLDEKGEVSLLVSSLDPDLPLIANSGFTGSSEGSFALFCQAYEVDEAVLRIRYCLHNTPAKIIFWSAFEWHEGLWENKARLDELLFGLLLLLRQKGAILIFLSGDKKSVDNTTPFYHRYIAKNAIIYSQQ